MASVTDVCKKMVDAVDDCLAVGVVDLSTGMMMGVHHTIPHFTQAYLDAVAAAAVEMFRVERAADRAAESARGEKITDSFEEVFISSIKTFHFMSIVKGKGAVVVMVTKKGVNQGMGWSALRNNLSAIIGALP
jgi:hypothetical protein